MPKRPTNDELEQRIRELVKESIKRRNAESALRESESRYRTLVENINIGVTLIDNGYNIVMTNAAQAKRFKKDSGEFIGQKCYQAFENKSHVCAHCPGRASMSSGLPAEVETEIVKKNGISLFLRIRTFPTFDSHNAAKGFISVVEDITTRKQEQERLITYQNQLRSLSSELLLIEERERRRIATDLHDSICQKLAISKIKLQSLRASVQSSEIKKPLDEICDFIEQTIADTRSLTFDLSPPVLYELGLEAAIEWLSEQIFQQHAILIEFKDDLAPKPIDNAARILLFQATRELMYNIVKHAKTNKAKISIFKNDVDIHIVVQDNGIGFNTQNNFPHSARPQGFGHFSIHERLGHIGGQFKIKSSPGKGTCVELIAPLKLK